MADDVKAGRVRAAALDRAVTQVLRAKFVMGLFDCSFGEPARVEAERPADRTLARGAEAIILLKNERGLLPLDPTRLKSIAIVGPNAVPCPRSAGGGPRASGGEVDT